ncbi:hypothetical protein A1O1_02213 [Capronia coronata CBS 617.96]|uniref:HIG1 domain-containing protein n=1 Tax=Capronia coronata CBS 617.96 TaxID=1182541 RepID=W9YVW0_9EURO|nr:uncharacterized protein A1O1_02213 [Capronia coronata CBS 617.96]EXJ93820.1 hypothetical protein A1O1_02213 [Capronia coronata CBS 617.96]
MKILTKEQEQAHYRETLKGGLVGGLSGLALGATGVVFAHRRYQFFRNLTIPLKAFLMTSAGTFGGIVTADHYSRAFEADSNPIQREYKEMETEKAEAERASKTFTERALEFGRKERYKIVFGSWAGSMVAAFALVNRNKYMTGQQKIVQARVYAQFLTLGVLVLTAAFEIADSRNSEGHYETVRYVDPNDPEHKRILEKQVQREVSSQGTGGGNDDLWKEMVAAEEERMKEREARHKEHLQHHHKKQNGNGDGKKKAEKQELQESQEGK